MLQRTTAYSLLSAKPACVNYLAIYSEASPRHHPCTLPMTTAREQQNIEWKESWREEYFKWICGFTNAQGGRIHIGKNDDGHAVGLPNIRKLLEDLPNQVRDLMGILVEVNRHEDNGLEYLEIVVEPYPYPISYRGQYHYRSGSTKQELNRAIGPNSHEAR